MKRFFFLVLLRRFLLTGLFLFAVSSSYSQESIYKSFELKNGASKPRINKLMKDKEGMLWTGTENGVFRFDGIEFQLVLPSDSLHPSPVSALFEDDSSVTWIGYENGRIARLKNDSPLIFNPEEGFPKVAISAFVSDQKGRVFFTTKGEGIYYIEHNRIFNINEDDGLSDNYCYSIVLLPDGRLCAGTDRGINFIRLKEGRKEITKLSSQDGLPDNIVRALCLDSKNKIWIGMQDRGVCRLDLTTAKIDIPMGSSEWTYGQLNALLPLEHELLIATEESGVLKLDSLGNCLPLFQSGQPLNISKCSDLLLDDEQNVWIVNGNHLIRSSGEKLRFLPGPDGKPFPSLHCIMADREGNIWFSPDQQLYKGTPGPGGNYTFQRYEVTEKNTMTDIVALYEDQYGFIWIGTMGEGVFRLNPSSGKITHIQGQDQLDNSSILSITGWQDNIWIAGFNGIVQCRIDSKGDQDKAVFSCPAFLESDKLNNNYIYCVFIDKRGRVWMGTDEEGLALWDQGKLTFFTVKDGLPSNTIHSISEGKDGDLWIATADAGLSKYDGIKFKNYSVKEGFNDPSPASLVCDKHGNVIAVNINGIDVYNPEKNSFIYHSAEEGLEELNPDPNSISRDRNGNIWIGSEMGILIYRSSSSGNWPQPGIRINAVSTFLQKVDHATQHSFAYDENNIRIDFTGIWYTNPGQLSYSYLLDGYTTKWQETRDRSITFPKLPPGKYKLHIRATQNPGMTEGKEVIYSFTIKPPLWQRWWFRSALFVLAALFFYLLIRRREDRLLKEDRLQKEKIEFQFETLRSQVNPHFLFNSFNTLISVIEDDPKGAVEYVERLSEFFRNIVTYRDKDIIPLEEEINLLDNYIFIQKKRYGDNLKLNINLDKGTRLSSMIAPLTLQLLAENAMKHNAVSRESQLTLDLYEAQGMLFVRNNINPKIQQERSTGLGLQNIISRYKLLTTVPVRIDQGADHFTVAIPLLKENLS